MTVTRPQDAERVNGLAVTANYFQVLGITPIVGRPLASDTSGPTRSSSVTAIGSDDMEARDLPWVSD